MKAILALEDGSYFEGESFGAERNGAENGSGGEVCFNTSMTGYQEILTDPSYSGQIVTLTYPEIGNYGINPEDVESKRIQVSGLVVKNCCEYPSNWRADDGRAVHPWSLSEYLKKNNVPGIMGVDTRRLTRILRETGAKNGLIVTGEYDLAAVLAKAKAVPSFTHIDFVKKVTIKGQEGWDEPEHALSFRPIPDNKPVFKVAALDYGIKYNILRKLQTQGAEVVRFPADAKAEDILAINPDGIFLSNGPGDPALLDYAVDTIKGLLGKKPIFGICLGHQLLARSLGGDTFKLKFGHRGANHPVKDLRTGKVEITSQNHGFAVDPKSLDAKTVEVTHVNLNDQTVAGLRHRTLPAYSVQYHPEASPGPKDSHYLFEEFFDQIRNFKQPGKSIVNPNIQISSHADEPCIEIKGEWNQSSLDALVKAFQKTLPKVESRLFLKLTEVNYLDNAGLGVIMFNMNVLAKRNAKLILLEPSKEVRRIFKATPLEALEVL